MYYLSNTISRLPEAPICAISTKKLPELFSPGSSGSSDINNSVDHVTAVELSVSERCIELNEQ